MVDGYIAPDELALMKQLESVIEVASKQSDMAGFALQKAHAEKRAAEAELRAAHAEYNGQIMKLLWQYKLENTDSFRQSDGFIIKGEKNVENNDTSSESEESQGDG